MIIADYEILFLREEIWVKRVVEQAKVDSPEADVLLSRLDEPHTVRYFVRYAKSIEWAKKLDSIGRLDELFEPTERSMSRELSLLARWLLAEFLLESSNFVVFLMHKHGLSIHPDFGKLITASLSFRRFQGQLKKRAMWVVLLDKIGVIRQNHGEAMHLMGSVVEDGGNDTALLLLKRLTQPYIVLEEPWKGWQTESMVQFDLGPDVRDGMLQYTWERYFRGRLNEYALNLIPILTNHLQEADTLRTASSGSEDELNIDTIDNIRSGIVGFLFDSAREVIDWLLEYEPNNAAAVVELWLNSTVPLLQKLGLHGLALAPPGKSRAVERMLDHNLLFEEYCDREVHQVLERRYGAASVKAKKRFRATVNKEWRRLISESQQPEEKLWRVLPLYELIVTALESNSSDAVLKRAQLRVERKCSDLPKLLEGKRKVRTMPTGGTVSPSEFSVISDSMSFEETINALLGANKFQRFASLQQVSATVAWDSAWGLGLAEHMLARKIWDKEFWGAVIWGFKGQQLDESQWRSVLDLMLNHQFLVDHAQLCARMISEGSDERKGTLTPNLADQVTKLAQLLQSHAEEVDRSQPRSQAGFLGSLQTVGGQLAMFWIRWISRALNSDNESLQVRAVDFLSNLESLLTGSSNSSHYARIMAASQFPFLYSQQKEWTKRTILQWFNWQDKERAEEAWNGFLVTNPIDINAVRPLLNHYRDTARNNELFRREVGELFIRQVAVIQLYGQKHKLQVPSDWLLGILSELEEPDRIMFAWKVREALGSMDEEKVKAQWHRWLSSHWKARLRDGPNSISPEEAATMATWSILLKPFFKEVVDLICKGPAPAFEYTTFFSDLREQDFIKIDPGSLLRMLAFVLEGADETLQKYHLETVGEILEDIIQPEQHVQQLRVICNHLSRLGYEYSLDLARRLGVLEDD